MILTNVRLAFKPLHLRIHTVVLSYKIMFMKNEPVVSYNHMMEDEAANVKRERISYSLYVLLVIDAVLISAIAVFVAKIVF